MLLPFLRTAGITLVIALLIGLACWQLSEPTAKPPMSSRQEDVVKASITVDQYTAEQKQAKAARADSAGKKAYVSGQAITRMAQQYHRLTYPTHAPLPATPSAAAVDSLQRFLTTY